MAQEPDLWELTVPATRDLLQVGPWAWPDVGDPRRADAGSPPALPPGAVPLVATTSNGVQLWRFDAGEDEPATAHPRAQFQTEAELAFGASCAALEALMPFAFRSVVTLRELRAGKRAATFVGAIGKRTTTPASTLDGRSFGLGFALALASAALKRPVPATVIASAEVLPDGRLQKVAHIEQKVEAVSSLAPTIGTFLVAADQFSRSELESYNLTWAPLKIVPVADVHSAIEQVLGPLSDVLGAVAEADVQDMARDLFALTMWRRAPVSSWTSVWKTCRALMEHSTATGDVRERLRFADMIAARHDHHIAPLEPPTLDFVKAQRRALRIPLLAQLIQQQSDLGWHDEAALRALVEEHLPADARDADKGQLILLGAWGRFLALTHADAPRALELQVEAAHAFYELGEDPEVSHPLCEGLRLAALLGEAATFGALQKLRDDVVRRRPQEAHSGFVALALGRGLIVQGDVNAGRTILEQLIGGTGGTAPSYVVDSAKRWLIPHVDAPRKAELIADLHAPPPKSRGDRLPFSILAEIDDADDEEAGGLLATLAKNPQLALVVERMQRGFGGTKSAAKTIARWFPY